MDDQHLSGNDSDSEGRKACLSAFSFLSPDDLWYPKAVVSALPYYEMSWVYSITTVSPTHACTHAHTQGHRSWTRAAPEKERT